ncbi:hypothetical protein SDC9_175175 [bioreactor metagenome]|uniref:Uncharacterized protein n=1 Tax=bioreactor metagenome TaxID=1076179 RepID=A0A645GLB4_9ZZZZ
MILGLPRNGDILNRLVDPFLRTGGGLVAEHDLSVAFVRPEVRIPVSSDEPSQPHSLVQQLELSPQIDQAVACRGAGEPHDALDHGAAFHQGIEALGAVVLER